jgi:tetratricopeptide (TPR) repeat protein
MRVGSCLGLTLAAALCLDATAGTTPASSSSTSVSTPAVPAVAPGSSAIDWGYTLSEALETTTGPDGKPSHSLDLSIIDHMLALMAPHLAIYPPHFDDAAQKADVSQKLEEIIGFLDILTKEPDADTEVLRRQAWACSLAYNLDVPSSGEKAVALYERILKRNPDDPDANYHYGGFLAGTDKLRDKAEPYLQKALALGVKKAEYTLAMYYLTNKDRGKALDYMQRYSADFPDDKDAKKLVEIIKNAGID